MLALIALALLPVASASAAGGIDRTFGDNGFIHYERSRAGYSMVRAIAMAVGPDGGIYILEDAVRCAPSCAADVYLVRLLPDGLPDATFAGGADGVRLFSDVPGGLVDSDSVQVATDRQGRILAMLRGKEAFSILRLDPNGRRDRSFGSEGLVSLPCSDCEDTNLKLHPEPDGGILLWGSRLELGSRSPPGPAFKEKLLLIRLTGDGELDPRYGRAGRAGTTLEEVEGKVVMVATRGGAVTLAAGCGRCRSKAGLFLERFRADGSRVGSFARRSVRSVRGLNLEKDFRPDDVELIVPRRHGEVDVFGNTDAGGYVIRVRRDGRLDRHYGHRGIRLFGWRLESAAPAGGGRVWAFGSVHRRPNLVFMLSRAGGVDPSFGDRRRHALSLGWDVSQVQVARQGRRAVLFTPGLQFCRGYCPPDPKLTRLLPGSNRTGRGL
ncbi:MAG TPA: hypothetical protein VG448_11060 [Solirubrobacterales bacterium]|nr:hypothetical protein [Solirubrobacterales bacterium]